jgi:hypothetical protein
MGTQLKLKGNSNGNGGYTTLQAGSAEGGEDIVSTLPGTGGVLLNDASPLNPQKLTGNLPELNGSQLTHLPEQYPPNGVYTLQHKHFTNYDIVTSAISSGGGAVGWADKTVTSPAFVLLWGGINFTPISSTSEIFIQCSIWGKGTSRISIPQFRLQNTFSGTTDLTSLHSSVISAGTPVGYDDVDYVISQSIWFGEHSPGTTAMQKYEVQARSTYSDDYAIYMNRGASNNVTYNVGSPASMFPPGSNFIGSSITFTEYEN